MPVSTALHMQSGRVTLEHRPDLLQRAEPRICAFDIETTKLPLQFPNAEYDQVIEGCLLPMQFVLQLQAQSLGAEVAAPCLL